MDYRNKGTALKQHHQAREFVTASDSRQVIKLLRDRASVKVFQDQTRSSDCFAFLNKFMTTAATPPEQGKTGDLESLVYLENMFQEYGYEDGLRDGELSGELEGRIFGCEKSFELGREIGFYAGVAETWMQLAQKYPDKVSSKALKNLHALQTMVDEFPKENCPNTDMFALRDKMKAKMKVIGSLLGFHQKFQEENPSSKLLY
ncbi:hypothetical protein VTP01DRAFT_4954 [Rhizomucor pusillus]|uniref:uncharacterized protein n=1 Tax=Rhizomucor pusillus TaxID=4840 RepID=UPI00374439CF